MAIAVAVVVVGVSLVEMVVIVGMDMIVAVGMAVLMGVGYTVVGVLVGMAMFVIVAVIANVVFVNVHSILLAFFFYYTFNRVFKQALLLTLHELHQ